MKNALLRRLNQKKIFFDNIEQQQKIIKTRNFAAVGW